MANLDGRIQIAGAFVDIREQTLRVALLGTAVSPGVFTVLVLIGKDRALRRLDRLAAFLTS